MTKELLLAIDNGSQSLRALLFDLHGNLLAKSRVMLDYNCPQPGWAEQDPEYYWQALLPMKKDYFIFVHFRGTKKSFDHNHAPEIFDPSSGQQEVYLTSRWQLGQLIREEFEISAPTGSYEMSLGVWDPHHTQQRLPIVSPSAELPYREEAIILQHNLTIR